MRVFVSWSGEQARAIGEALRDWLPSVIQSVKPYFSPADISKGARWASDVARELEASKVGLIIVTRDSLQSDWVMFEAGALSRSVEQSRVIPLLFRLTPGDVTGPLAQFQLAAFNHDQLLQVLETINQAQGEAALAPTTLKAVFEKWWPDLQSKVDSILDKASAPVEPVRSDREVLDEILSILRSAQRDNQVKRLVELLFDDTYNPRRPRNFLAWPPSLDPPLDKWGDVLSNRSEISPVLFAALLKLAEKGANDVSEPDKPKPSGDDDLAG